MSGRCQFDSSLNRHSRISLAVTVSGASSRCAAKERRDAKQTVSEHLRHRRCGGCSLHRQTIGAVRASVVEAGPDAPVRRTSRSIGNPRGHSVPHPPIQAFHRQHRSGDPSRPLCDMRSHLRTEAALSRLLRCSAPNIRTIRKL